ncbi:MAG: Crp/Fnr family transcriptional regulator [Bacteroidia bacterium]|nr:Crp/Fnr family transcriptional regulator [Bacteroidia bacterium]
MNTNSNIWFFEEVKLTEWFCPTNHAQENYDREPKRSFKKGEFIYFSDDTADKVFFIHMGAVKIATYTDDGNELIKAVLSPGEIFGEMAVYGEYKRSDYAQAVEDSAICILTREQAIMLMRDLNDFQVFMFRLIGERMIFTQKRLENLLFKDARTRVIGYILEQSRKSSRRLADGSLSVRNYLTHQEIASYTGTSRQTVTTLLNEFRDKGWINFDRKRFHIRDEKALIREMMPMPPATASK